MARNSNRALDQLLNSKHQSSGCQQACYQFIWTDNDGVIQKIITVHANSPWKVTTMELILSVDAMVSGQCSFMAVAREASSFDSKNPLCEQVSFVDFMLSVVPSDRLLNDYSTASAFRQSLTDSEKEYVIKRTREDEEEVPDTKKQKPGRSSPRNIETPATSSKERPKMDKLCDAMTGLGFRRADVQKFAASLSDEEKDQSLSELIRSGVRYLT